MLCGFRVMVSPVHSLWEKKLPLFFFSFFHAPYFKPCTRTAPQKRRLTPMLRCGDTCYVLNPEALLRCGLIPSAIPCFLTSLFIPPYRPEGVNTSGSQGWPMYPILNRALWAFFSRTRRIQILSPQSPRQYWPRSDRTRRRGSEALDDAKCIRTYQDASC
ncbi:hypothetical protein F4823DRAFT_591632 [Ustulina deusta]|nr:hypothetical protein F4823DRAFT_591632 [Ustulina deusta]